MEPFLNWKIIVIYAFVLLIAGVASGIFGLQPTSHSFDAVLRSYVLNQCVSILVNIAIFAHISYKIDYRPFAYALLALLLSNGVALAMLPFFQSSLGVQLTTIDVTLVQMFEFLLMVFALLIGVKFGISLKRRKLLQAVGEECIK